MSQKDYEHYFVECTKCGGTQLDGVPVPKGTVTPPNTLHCPGIHQSCAQADESLKRARAKAHAMQLRALAAVIEEIGTPLSDSGNLTPYEVKRQTDMLLDPKVLQQWQIVRRMPG